MKGFVVASRLWADFDDVVSPGSKMMRFPPMAKRGFAFSGSVLNYIRRKEEEEEEGPFRA